MYRLILIFNLLFASFCFCQNSIAEVLKIHNDNTVKYVYPKDLFKQKNTVYLDAREKKEFDVSHIKNSIYVGFDEFDSASFEKLNIDKNQKIIVYCSLGVRSEKIAKKLISVGYTDVSNLYGGIFLWKNEKGTVVDTNNKITENIHAFSIKWSVYLTSGIKVYN